MKGCWDPRVTTVVGQVGAPGDSGDCLGLQVHRLPLSWGSGPNSHGRLG